MEKIRRYFRFYGRVQGVGFRYRAYYAARNFGVSGWVKNRSDGSVEMEAEGLEESIDRLVMSIEEGRFIHIDNLEVKGIPVRNESGFYVKD